MQLETVMIHTLEEEEEEEYIINVSGRRRGYLIDNDRKGSDSDRERTQM